MPSRKKSQGKARKARKGSQQGPKLSSSQVQSAVTCTHGLEADISQSCIDFVDTFHSELYRICGGQEDLTPLRAVMLSMDLTRVKHEDVWVDSNKRNTVKKVFVKLGTDQVLKANSRQQQKSLKQQSNFDFAAALAVGVLRLDDEDTSSAWSILDSRKGRGKIRDMILSSGQETTKFFSKRTSCSCLDEMAARVKKEAKMGTCIHCDKQSECSAMFLCGNCRIHQYCSKACQREAWPEHKPICAQLCRRFNRLDKE